jgi:glyoxylase-like metal-dependent hydrolase (beta-lactamase superfamily II)
MTKRIAVKSSKEAYMTNLNRRTFLAGSAAAATLAADPLRAAAPPAGKQHPGLYRYKIGSYELTALYDGTWFRKIDDKFVRNAGPTEVQKALTDLFLQPGIVPTSFTALLVNTGSKLVLIDTGTAGQLGPTTGHMLDALAAAGIAPSQIDTILISHFHPDHINGIKDKEGRKVFSNAEIMVPAPEWAHWMDDARLNAAPEAARGGFLNVRRIFRDIAGELTRFEPGKEVAPGIASIAAYGHTPGHTVYSVASGDQSMLVLGDTTNHPWLFARNPHWQGVFDIDGNMAVETRKRLLDRAAADRMLVQGYHFPFPACGHIAKTSTGYDVVPVMWQPM